jgi:hypothetical protein
MSNINLLKDKDVNCFIIYFYFALLPYLLFSSYVWFHDRNHWCNGYYEVVWQFDEILYAYLIWPLFSLLNLSYITIKNNKIKLYFTTSLIIFISLVSTYFILSLGNIYKINFPEQFFSLYLNSIMFVIIIISTFILFSIVMFKNNFNRYNFILINSYFFLIILLISVLFIVMNKPKSPLASEYFSLFIFGNLHYSYLFLFIPFLTFLFFILIHFFKYQIIPYIIIVALAYWDYFIGLSMYRPSSADSIIFLIFIFLPLIIWSLIYFRERSYSLFQKGILFNIIMVLFYSYLFIIFPMGIIDYCPIPKIMYNPGPVYELSSLISAVILTLMLVNLIIYLEIRSTLKASR